MSCGRTYVQLDENILKQNESQILQEVYWSFSKTDEFERGQRMKPPMVFDDVYAICLNLHPESIDLEALDKPENESDVSWSDWEVDNDEIRSMIENKTPIVELTMHWVDPASMQGSDGYITYTYFFPDAKVENGKLELGKKYKVKSRAFGLRYFPYFHNNVLNMPLGARSYLDINDTKVLDNFRVFHNGDLEGMRKFMGF